MPRVLRSLARAVIRVLEAADDALVDFGDPPPEPPATTQRVA